MQVCLLGPLVLSDGALDVPVGGRLQRRLLARLAMDAGRPVSIEDLETAVWGDEPPRAARHTIAASIFRLRRLGVAVTTRDDRYVLETSTDVDEVQRLAAEAQAAGKRGDRQVAAAAVRDALALWRGEPLADLADLPEARIVVARLEELTEGLREELLTLALDEGSSAELIGQARQLVTEQPYRERRWELLMLALYRAGRQAEALDAYAECRRRLLDDLGLDPGVGLRRMQQAVLAQDPTLDPPTAAGDADGADRSGSIPAATRVPGTSTRLIGRSVERRDLAEIWDRARLATLLGPPGVGKTRLALELAQATDRPAWFVPLEQLPQSQSVAGAILDVVAPESRAVDAARGVTVAIASSAGLLVLDGCEGRASEVAQVIELILGRCASVRILATTRERLGMRDEALVPVGPLAASEAVELLVDRARLLDPRFKLALDEVSTADRLCALVDQLPLGIELIARHLQLLRLDEVIERVESDLGRWAGGPVGGRPGLWAALDASVERLRPAERRALLALAVVVADADISLIEEVAAFEPDADAFEVVARLVDASLVQVRSAVGPTRYELLRTVAAHTLASASVSDLDLAGQRYADAIVARVARLSEQLATSARSPTLRLIDREMPHVRSTLDRLAADPGDRASASRGLEIAVGLTDYWIGRHPAEGLQWLGRLIDAAAPDGPLLAAAQLARSHLAYWVTDFALGAVAVAEAQQLYAQLGDRLGEGQALRRRGAIAAATDDLAAARAFLEASLERLDEAGEEKEVGTTLLHLGSLLADEGVVDSARSALERSLAIAVATQDPLAHGHVLAALNLAQWKAGDLDAALQSGNEALLIFRELGHRPTEGTVAYRLAAVARGLGRPRAARRYAELAVDAGEQSSTRTTIALGHLNLARIDLDAGDLAPAGGHLVIALELVDADADRWVLVEALEVTARLIVASDRLGATGLLASAARIRAEIRQPVAPTEAADVEWAGRQGLVLELAPGHDASEPGAPPQDAADALASALAQARDLAKPESAHRRAKRAKG